MRSRHPSDRPPRDIFLVNTKTLFNASGFSGSTPPLVQGKSAIARSVVQYCLDTGIPIARFFFFRSDPSRCNVAPVVATLVDQLMRSIPALTPIIIPAIESDPLIFTKSLETQFKSLVFSTASPVNGRLPEPQNAFLFDGVDECDRHDGQTQLIRIVSDFINKHDYPSNCVLRKPGRATADSNVQSTPTSRISFMKSHWTINTPLLLYPTLRQQNHSRRSWNTHHLSHTLPPDWPSLADAEMIVTKSSGQFIFAAVSLKFISTPHKSPDAQLKIILGLRAVKNSKSLRTTRLSVSTYSVKR